MGGGGSTYFRSHSVFYKGNYLNNSIRIHWYITGLCRIGLFPGIFLVLLCNDFTHSVSAVSSTLFLFFAGLTILSLAVLPLIR